MKKIVEDVLEFRKACNLPVADRPRRPSSVDHRAALRCFVEEFIETLRAAGVYVTRKIEDDLMYEADHAEPYDTDNVELVDGICDTIVTAVGVGAVCGLGDALPPVWMAVHLSNMAKTTGKRDENGKLCKPEGWVSPKPEIERVIDELEE